MTTVTACWRFSPVWRRARVRGARRVTRLQPGVVGGGAGAVGAEADVPEVGRLVCGIQVWGPSYLLLEGGRGRGTLVVRKRDRDVVLGALAHPPEPVDEGVPRDDVRGVREPAGGGVAVRGVAVLDLRRRTARDVDRLRRPERERVAEGVCRGRGRALTIPPQAVHERVPARDGGGVRQAARRRVAVRSKSVLDLRGRGRVVGDGLRRPDREGVSSCVGG